MSMAELGAEGAQSCAATCSGALHVKHAGGMGQYLFLDMFGGQKHKMGLP